MIESSNGGLAIRCPKPDCRAYLPISNFRSKPISQPGARNIFGSGSLKNDWKLPKTFNTWNLDGDLNKIPKHFGGGTSGAPGDRPDSIAAWKDGIPPARDDSTANSIWYPFGVQSVTSDKDRVVALLEKERKKNEELEKKVMDLQRIIEGMHVDPQTYRSSDGDKRVEGAKGKPHQPLTPETLQQVDDALSQEKRRATKAEEDHRRRERELRSEVRNEKRKVAELTKVVEQERTRHNDEVREWREKERSWNNLKETYEVNQGEVRSLWKDEKQRREEAQAEVNRLRGLEIGLSSGKRDMRREAISYGMERTDYQFHRGDPKSQRTLPRSFVVTFISIRGNMIDLYYLAGI